MKNNCRNKLLVLFFYGILILGFISCKPTTSIITKTDDSQVSAKQYSGTFRVSGNYVCYDGLHYKYHCINDIDVSAIIHYYYPDCFDVKIFNPGTKETGYLNTIFYATWKSYLDFVQIK